MAMNVSRPAAEAAFQNSSTGKKVSQVHAKSVRSPASFTASRMNAECYRIMRV
jgi:hypothetical protein